MPDYKFPGFPDGINNVAPSDKIPATALDEAVNVDLIGPEGRVKRRDGVTRVYAGVNTHSAYSTHNFVLAADGGVLKSWVDFEQAPVEISPVADRVDYAEVNGGVVWVSGGEIGFVNSAGEPEAFGIAAPEHPPAVEAVDNGGWYSGSIMVTVTFTDENGVESGAPQAAWVAVEEGMGIRLTGIPQSDEATAINVYASNPDGEVLYYRTTIPAGTTSYTLPYKRALRQLRSQFMNRMPGGNLVTAYNGFLFVAHGNRVTFSEPMRFDTTHEIEGFFQEASEVNLLLKGDTGVFVGCDERVFFYKGNDPQQFSRDVVSGPAIPGASMSVDGGFVNPRYQGRVLALWWTVEGAMIIGLPDGSSEVVRDTEFRIPDAESGAMAQVVRGGRKQVVSVTKNPKPDSSMSFSDDVTIEVHRNGVPL